MFSPSGDRQAALADRAAFFQDEKPQEPPTSHKQTDEEEMSSPPYAALKTKVA